MSLKRKVQCDKCPWKVTTDPWAIPGYCRTKHEALRHTIAQNPLDGIDTDIRAMSCHEHRDQDGAYCIGWLSNQLGQGNNLALRLHLRRVNLKGVRTVGEQHEHFDSTLPQEPLEPSDAHG